MVKQYIMVAAHDKTFPFVVMTLRKMKRKGSGSGFTFSLGTDAHGWWPDE